MSLARLILPRCGAAALLAWLGLLAVPRVAAQAPALDGPNHPMQDALLDRLTGSWDMAGQVASRPVAYRADASWVLNHQFLRLELTDTATPPRYAAIVYLGFDNASERYVAHWLDIFGGRFSETLGFGRRTADSVSFVFEYPDGPFHTTFLALPDSSWRVHMRTRNQRGAWVTFADYRLRRRQS